MAKPDPANTQASCCHGQGQGLWTCSLAQDLIIIIGLDGSVDVKSRLAPRHAREEVRVLPPSHLFLTLWDSVCLSQGST